MGRTKQTGRKSAKPIVGPGTFRLQGLALTASERADAEHPGATRVGELDPAKFPNWLAKEAVFENGGEEDSYTKQLRADWEAYRRKSKDFIMFAIDKVWHTLLTPYYFYV